MLRCRTPFTIEEFRWYYLFKYGFYFHDVVAKDKKKNTNISRTVQRSHRHYSFLICLDKHSRLQINKQSQKFCLYEEMNRLFSFFGFDYMSLGMKFIHKQNKQNIC